MKFILLSMIVTLMSCSSMKPHNDRMRSESYQNRNSLSENFSQKKLTVEQVKALLEQKLALPKEIKIAVVKLEHEWDLTTMTEMHFQRNQSLIVGDQSARAFHDIQGKQKNIHEIAVVPGMLIPKDKTIESMRDIAALMQADLLMVIKTRSQTESKFKMFNKDEVKTVTTVETMIIDVKTGVIPYTNVTSESFHQKQDKDFSYEELYLKATLKAEDKALAEVFRNVGEYFN